MPTFRHEIAKRIKGSLMEDESWWHLCYDSDTGKFWIEHDWDKVDAYRSSKPADVGSATIEIDGYRGPGAENVEEAKRLLLEKARAYHRPD